MIESTTFTQEVDKLLNLISAIIGVEIGAVNKEMVAIAGTGKYRKNIGQPRPKGSYAEKCVKTGESFVLKDPPYGTHCSTCEGRSICPYSMAMYRPIFVQGSIEGAIFFLAYTKHHREIMTTKFIQCENYLNAVSSLIAQAIAKEAVYDSNRKIISCFESAINSVEEPIIIVDEKDRIFHLNPAAELVLRLNTGQMLNLEIKDLIKEYSFSEVFGSRICRQESLVSNASQQNKKGGKTICIHTNPVLFEGVHAGCIIHIEGHGGKKAYSFLTKKKGEDPFLDIIGNSKSIRDVVYRARQIAVLDSTVLLRGETGSGKDLIAKGIHEASNRTDKPLVVINCSTLPDNLLESELFGYVGGAFTGAKREGKTGKFELANGGTIFLDEVGDLPILLQAKLLRILEDGMVEKIGSLVPQRVDVRIIAATNRNLEEMVCQGTFRQDLYYRLNIIQIDLPPLRDRTEDIHELFKHFVGRFVTKTGLPPRSLNAEVEKILCSYPWPGNVRELRNTVEYIIQTSVDEYLKISDFPQSLRCFYYQDISNENVMSEKHLGSRLNNLELFKKNEIQDALARYGFSLDGKKKAADYLGISLTTLYRRIARYGLKKSHMTS
jgi:transcriptional regulator with PAS, ATPase and Fis domain